MITLLLQSKVSETSHLSKIQKSVTENLINDSYSTAKQFARIAETMVSCLVPLYTKTWPIAVSKLSYTVLGLCSTHYIYNTTVHYIGETAAQMCWTAAHEASFLHLRTHFNLSCTVFNVTPVGSLAPHETLDGQIYGIKAALCTLQYGVHMCQRTWRGL